MTRDFPEQALVQVADFFKGSNVLIGAKKRITGLRLQATDATWSTGAGPAVSGPLPSLIMAGRPCSATCPGMASRRSVTTPSRPG